MPNWKKVIISGSNAVLNQITASTVPSSQDNVENLVAITTDGNFIQIPQNQLEAVEDNDFHTAIAGFLTSSRSILVTGSVAVSGSITASHDISASGHLFASLSLDSNTGYKTVMYDTASGKLFFTGSYAPGATSAGLGQFETMTISNDGDLNPEGPGVIIGGSNVDGVFVGGPGITVGVSSSFQDSGVPGVAGDTTFFLIISASVSESGQLGGAADTDWGQGGIQLGQLNPNDPPAGGAQHQGETGGFVRGSITSSQQVIVRHNSLVALSESICGTWGLNSSQKNCLVGFQGLALDTTPGLVTDTYNLPGFSVKHVNTHVTAVHQEGAGPNNRIFPVCLTGKLGGQQAFPGGSPQGGFGLNDGYPYNNLRFHQGYFYEPLNGGGGGGGNGGDGGPDHPGGDSGNPGTPDDDFPGGMLHIQGGIRATLGTHDLTQGSASFGIPTGSNQAPPAVEVRPQAGILFFETGSTLSTSGSYRLASASAILSFETSSKSVQLFVGSKESNDLTRVMFISHSGDNPRIGFGVNKPIRAFDFKEVRDNNRGGEILIRGSRTTKGAENNDEVGRINFAIDSSSFGKIDTSGSAAEIVSVVDSVDTTGVQGSLSLRVAATKTSSPIQRIKVTGNPSNKAIEFTGSAAFDSDINIGGAIKSLSGDITASNSISASGNILAEDYLLPTVGGSLKTQNNGESISITDDNIDLGFGSSWALELRKNEGVVLYDQGNVGLYKDFRVEGESDTHLFFITGGDSRIGIGTSTPSEKLTVQGNISASGAIIANTITGSLQGNATGLTGTPNITVGTIEATSLNVTNITSSIVTSSIVQTEGSNIFGDAISDTQTFNGHITASGNISASGTVIGSNLSGINTGDQDLSSYIQASQTSSFLTATDTGSLATTAELNASSSALQTNIDTKATIAQLNASSSALQTNIDTKATIAQLNASSSALQTNIDTKATIAQLNASSSALQTNINVSIQPSQTGSFLTAADTGSFITVAQTSSFSTATGVEDNADVTDTINVTAAGALMDSELAEIATVKALTAAGISGSFNAASASLSTRVTANDAKLTANTSNVTSAGALMDSELAEIATVKALTAAGISGSFTAASASFAADIITNAGNIGTTTNALTVDNATLQLNTGTTFNGSAARTISIKDGGVDSDALADDITVAGTLTVAADIQHSGDTDTKIAFSTDQISIKAGNTSVFTSSPTGSVLPNVHQNIFDTGSLALNANSAFGDIVKFGGSSTVAGGLYYLKPDGTWGLAQANAAATSTGSLAVAVGTNSTTDGMCIRGFVNPFTDPGAGIGSPVYVSDTAPGRILATAPDSNNDVVRIVGHQYGTDLVYFNPSNDFIIVTA